MNTEAATEILKQELNRRVDLNLQEDRQAPDLVAEAIKVILDENTNR